jgi:hypothetical protein
MAATISPPDVHGARRRKHQWMAAAECLLVLLLFAADVYRWIPVSKTPFLLGVGWLSMRLRRVTWGSVGFSRPRNWAVAIGLGLLAGVGMDLLELFGTNPLFSRLVGRPADLSDFHPLVQGTIDLVLIYMGQYPGM